MPPNRRTSARPAGATPAKLTFPARGSTRGNSALPSDVSTTKRLLRSNSPANGNIANPNLPEIQTQQSYAYGSSKTPLLPDQLVASEKMTLKQMAETLDSGIRQAEKQLESHAAEAEARFSSPQADNDARAERAKRRSASRESSVDSETRKTKRTAAWASSLDTRQLDNVSEEPGSPESSDTRQGTDPSSFPSGYFDHSYNYERGQRRPRTSLAQPNSLQQGWTALKQVGGRASRSTKQIITAINDFVSTCCSLMINGVIEVPTMLMGTRVIQFVKGACLITMLGFLVWATFCTLYKWAACKSDLTPLYLQTFCGKCYDFPYPLSIFSNNRLPSRIGDDDIPKYLDSLTRQMRDIEARMDSKIDAKFDVIRSQVQELDRDKKNLQNRFTNLESKSSASSIDPSPLMQRVNYFSPGTGATINPHLTSPTKQVPYSLPTRILLRMIGWQRYQAKPPSTALEAWKDVGDCWCASASGTPNTNSSVLLSVSMGYMIYPTELVVEHYPISGSVSPDTTPKVIEVWGEFSHLSPPVWETYHLKSSQQANHPIFPSTMAKIGTAHYVAGGHSGASVVQTFTLDVNQYDLALSTRDITLRVQQNYGAAYTCLYRVRLHGVPVVPHAKLKDGS